MAKAVLITGSNMGDAAGNISAARAMIAVRIGAITAQSAVEESEPWGDMKGAARFLNQVLVVETELGPHALLDEINSIEKALGRTRSGETSQDRGQDERQCRNRTVAESPPNRTYTSRTMDIDILFYDDAAIADERLTIPHPLIRERRFVLAPLAAVMPGYVHPSYGRSIAELLEELKNNDI